MVADDVWPLPTYQEMLCILWVTVAHSVSLAFQHTL
jgi:hypothetical protein